MTVDKPTKCISSRQLIEINAQVQFIDFEGRSDGESLLKILSQLRPRRVVVVRGSPQNTEHIAKHCELNIGARVYTPNRGEIIDATTETHIYQVRLTEALISQLDFQKGRDAEVAWIDAQIVVRNKQIDTVEDNADNQNSTNMDVDDAVTVTNTSDNKDDNKRILTLEPMDTGSLPAHNSVFINELKLSDFKQVLMKNNINSEFSGGVLMCSNGTLSLRRVDTGKVTIEGCLSEEYFRIRELLYEQYAIV